MRHLPLVLVAITLATILTGSAAGQGVNQILTVTPSTATQGTSGLTVTFTLDTDGPPYAPQDFVPVTNATLGTATATFMVHTSQYEVVAVFDIPVEETLGARNVAVEFPGPGGGTITFSKTGGFTVTGEGSGLQPYDGYNLFTSNMSTNTFLMDNNGNTVHTWTSAYRPGQSVYLLEDGTLLRTANTESGDFSVGGQGGRVERFSWDGDLLWAYDYSTADYRQHHDIAFLPNSNVLMIAWEHKTSAEAIAAGRDPSLLTGGELWPDHVIEVAPTGTYGGTIVWEWHLWDHLVQEYDASKANYGIVSNFPERVDLNHVLNGSADWNHINSVAYNADLDQVVLSVHNFNEIWVIDHSTTTEEAAGHAGGDSGMGGDLLYRWGNPQAYDQGGSGDQQLFVQHDAEWIGVGLPGAGNILVFNNGTGRPGGNYSSIDELVTPLAPDGTYTSSSAYGPSGPSWTYTNSPATNFYAMNISGSQRLPNGHTLICDGPAGRFFEVATNGQAVWEYEYGAQVFRVERYGLDYPGFAGTALDPYQAPDLPYAVVDTAQDSCYDNSAVISAPAPGASFAGQDAQYDGYQPSYTVSGDGLTVYDHITQLTWTQSPDTDEDGDIDVDDKKTYAEAPGYVATLNAATYGGYSDWRVPSIKELYSLMDFRGTDPNVEGTDTTGLVPFIDTNYFAFGYGDTNAGERVIDSQFVTTTLYVTNVMNGQPAMFGVNLADGRIKGYPTTKGHYVLCVRGNTNYGINAFGDNGDGTVTDRATGLMWQQADSGSGMLWGAALAYAEGLELAGYRDWRLPNAKELQSILDYTRSPDTTGSAAIDPVFSCTQISNEYPAIDYPWYWSSTTHVRQGGSGSSGAYVCFGRGTGYMDSQWMDVHGAGCQRGDRKDGDFTGYTYVYDGYYLGVAPQGDATRMYDYVRCVRVGATAPDTDTDVDELTDWYEYNYSTNITNMVATADDDEDGSPNIDEAGAGTIPTDGDSVLAITDVSINASNVVVTWMSELGQTYTLKQSTNLLSNDFTLTVVTGINGTGTSNSYTNSPDAPCGAYRVFAE